MQHGHAHARATRGWHRSYAIGAAIVALLALALLSACGDDNSDSDQPAARLVREQTASSCEAPPLPPGTPTPLLEDPLAAGTPTPQPPDPTAKGEPSQQVVEEVSAAIRNFVNCWNQRKYEQVATLATPSFLKSVFMQVKPQDAAIVMTGLPDLLYDIKSFGDFQQLEDGRVSVAYDYIFVHQERKGHWFFVKQDGWWMMDREVHIVPEVTGDRSVIDVEGNNFAYVIGPNPKAAPVTVFHTHNPSDLPHDFLVVKIKPGVDPLSLLQPDLPHPQGVEFIAQTTLEPGEQEDMVTYDITPGTYLFICQFRYPGGTPHAQRGMVNLFDIK